MSNTEPQFTLKQDGVFTRVNMGYTNDALDAMARRAAERIEDELAQQLLARLGYVKPVRCRDCKHSHITMDGKHCKWCDLLATHDPDGYGDPPNGYDPEPYFDADFFCAWGERKEGE